MSDQNNGADKRVHFAHGIGQERVRKHVRYRGQQLGHFEDGGVRDSSAINFKERVCPQNYGHRYRCRRHNVGLSNEAYACANDRTGMQNDHHKIDLDFGFRF